MASLYDRADIYDLFNDEQKYQTIKKHWEILLRDCSIHSLLDVSIGTGALTLPLAELGIELHGSDLSGEMLAKCDRNAKERGFALSLCQSDFRELTKNIRRKFGCVASTGNSLPYVNNQEIIQVLREMDALVLDNGYLYFDMRNWDKILREHKRFYLYDPVFQEDTRIDLIQVWDYNPDRSMDFHLLYTFEKENRIIQKEHFQEHYFPVERRLLLDTLTGLGYKDLRVLCHPACYETVSAELADWYCVIARKPSRSSTF